MLTLTNTALTRCYEGAFSLSTASSGASDYVVINPDAQWVSVQLKVLSTAEAAVQATVSPIANVIAGTADWVTWSKGALTGGSIAQDATTGPVTAVRITVSTTKAGNNAVLAVRTQA